MDFSLFMRKFHKAPLIMSTKPHPGPPLYYEIFMGL